MTLTKAQKQALEILRMRGTAVGRGTKTTLDPPTIHYLTEAHLACLGLIEAVPMVPHCDNCYCESGRIQLTLTGQMIAQAAEP
jgi:hypothetical protein